MSHTNHNIVIVTSEFPPQPGGIGNHAYNLAQQLHNSGCVVRVIADQRSNSGKEEAKYDQSLDFTVERIQLKNRRFRMYISRVIKTFKSFNDATHVIATGKFALWNVAFCSFFFNRKTLAIIHGTEVNFKNYIVRNAINFSLRRFDKIVAVSNYTKQFVTHLNKEIIVIPNGIDLSKWVRNSSSSKVLKGDPILVTVGRVSTRKGQLNVIKHLPELVKKYPELHYHCIGISSEADAFIKEAKKLNVISSLTFHGSVDDTTLKQYLVESDVFVMLSAESNSGDVEGFGIAILEANALGIPAIGSLGCGIEDAISQKESGILVNPNDTIGFIKALEAILNQKEKYKLGAKEWATKHNWSFIIQRYLEVLQ